MWWILFLLGLTYIPIIILEKYIYTNKDNIRINVIYSLLTFIFLLIYDLFLNTDNNNKSIREIFKSYKKLFKKQNTTIILMILSIIVSYRLYLFYKGFINYDVKIYLPILSIISIVLSFLIGIFYYQEEMNNYNILGLILSIISIIFISYKK